MQNLPINIYVPYSADDEAWGLYLMDVGRMQTPPNSEYPVGSHPPDYIFNFQKGRVLHEYQILYINEGGGVFDSRSSGKIDVETGSIIILFPDEWHRYRPLRKTGWKESWIGFNGSIADQIMNSSHFSRREPIIKLGIRSRLNTIYDRVFDECKQENPGYQQVAAGLIMELLGLIQMLRRPTSLTSRHIQSQIYQSRRIIDVSFKEELDPQEIAEAVGMGYSNFRKHFRLLTGFSPSQYIIHLRLRSAKELLYNTNLTVKEVASKSGFNSSYYFIRMFKEKVGTTPRAYRLNARGLD
jgi:AraC-like DNA-binding protein